MEIDQNTPALYANLFRVGHSLSEFVVEFCQAYQAEHADAAQAKIMARIVMTPAGARELQTLLCDSLKRHSRLIAKQAKRPPDERP